jgi:hypothetical protein
LLTQSIGARVSPKTRGARLRRAVRVGRPTGNQPLKPRAATRTWPPARSAVRVMVSVMVVMVVVPMMRRVRQRDVCEQQQRDGNSNNLTHDSIP